MDVFEVSHISHSSVLAGKLLTPDALETTAGVCVCLRVTHKDKAIAHNMSCAIRRDLHMCQGELGVHLLMELDDVLIDKE